MIDGTFTPIDEPSDMALQHLYNGAKGTGFNHILVFCFDGTICAYSI
jgi:hypothetical protein